MKRVEGTADVRLIECVSPVKNKWRIRWDIIPNEDGSASYMEMEFSHKPSEDEIQSTIANWYNKQTDLAILSGFVWNDMMIWLSQENQFNYKAAYDMAVQTEGKSLPVTFKFGTDDEPCYYEFNTMLDFTDFYSKALAYIQHTLAEGWSKKATFNAMKYNIE